VNRRDHDFAVVAVNEDMVGSLLAQWQKHHKIPVVVVDMIKAPSQVTGTGSSRLSFGCFVSTCAYGDTGRLFSNVLGSRHVAGFQATSMFDIDDGLKKNEEGWWLGREADSPHAIDGGSRTCFIS
jgi:hypothetical protein